MYREKNKISQKAILTTQNLENARINNLSTTLGFEYNKKIDKNTQGYRKIQKDPTSRKLFITSIDSKVTDSLMESLLQEFGDVIKWKRNKNAEGKSVAFGIVEFENVKGLLNCMRIFKGYQVFGNRIEIKMGEKAKLLIAEYVNELKNDYRKKDTNLCEEEIDKRVIEEFSKNDQKILDKIYLYLKKFGNHREKIVKTHVKSSTQKYTEEKLILQKKKYGLINNKELNEMFERELENWLIKEDNWAKDREDEIYRKKEKNRRKMEKLERELEFDDNLDDYKNVSDYEYNQKKMRSEQWRRDKEFINKKNKILDISIDLKSKDKYCEKKEKRDVYYNNNTRRENSNHRGKKTEFKLVVSSIKKNENLENKKEELKLDINLKNNRNKKKIEIGKEFYQEKKIYIPKKKEFTQIENNYIDDIQYELKKRGLSIKMKEDKLMK